MIGAAVEIGDDCRIGANVTLSHCLIGVRVVLHPGVRIGQAGFGFAPDPAGPVKVPQLGRVLIGDDVDIGANTTIDRGSGHDTVIGAGTMIDNLVQIGHNVVIGRGCVLAGQVGISGSTRLGDFVMIGGQGGLAGHLNIGRGARIAAKSRSDARRAGRGDGGRHSRRTDDRVPAASGDRCSAWRKRRTGDDRSGLRRRAKLPRSTSSGSWK